MLGHGWLEGASWVSNETLCVVTRAGAFRYDVAAGAMTPIVEGVHPRHAAASPDGARLAYGDGADVVVITTEGATLFRAPLGPVRALAFSPDGRALLLVEGGGRTGPRKVRSIDATTGATLALYGFDGPAARSRAVEPDLLAASPDGEWVACSADAEVWLWRSGGTPAARWPAPGVKGLAFAGAGGRLLVAGGDLRDGDRWLYLAEPGGQPVRWFPAHVPVGRWLALALAPGGERFAAAAFTEGVHVFGLDGARASFLSERDDLRPEPGGRRPPHVVSLAFSPDGARLAVGTSSPGPDDDDGPPASVQVFDVAGRERQAMTRDFAAGVRDLARRDGRLFFVNDGKVKAMPVAADRPRTLVRRRVSGDVLALAVDADGGRVAAAFPSYGQADPSGKLAVHDAATGALLRETPGLPQGVYPNALAFSPDGLLLAVAYDRALVFRLNRKAPLARLAPPKGVTLDRQAPTSLAFRRDGALLGVAWRDGKVRLYAPPGFELAGELETPSPPGRLESFAFSPDGRRAFAGDAEGRVHAWDVDAGEPAWHFDAAAGGVARLVTSSDGLFLAGGTSEGRLVLVDAARGERVSAWRAHGGVVTGLAFSAEDQSLFSASDDGTVLEWPLPAGAAGRPSFLARGPEAPSRRALPGDV
jgi:WD40 repeat protein